MQDAIHRVLEEPVLAQPAAAGQPPRADSRSLSDLYQRHSATLIRLLRGRLLNRQEAEDVTQEAYLRICAAGGTAALENPKAFLFKTAANLATDLRRRQRVRHSVQGPAAGSEQGGLDNIAAVIATPEQIVSDRPRLALLEQSIRRLPAKCRTVFVLHRFQGLPYAEIATVLGITVHAVEKHIMRALKRCQEDLERASRQRPRRFGERP
jgi:RNA polymerase sigma factor (sigma-70 family)